MVVSSKPPLSSKLPAIKQHQNKNVSLQIAYPQLKIKWIKILIRKKSSHNIKEGIVVTARWELKHNEQLRQ